MATLPRSYSSSAASTYDQCPRRWKHRYVDKLPDPPGEAAVLGTFAHSVLEQLCQEPSSTRTSDRARVLAAQVWKMVVKSGDFRSLGLSQEAQRQFKWKAWTAIEGLWVLEDPATVDVASTEQRVSTNLAGIPFVGFLDRLDRSEDGLVVTDYKTGRPPRQQDKESSLNQVLLYAAAVKAQSGEQPARARLLYLGSSILETTVSPDRLESAIGRLADSWDRLTKDCEVDRFTAIAGPLCGWCSFVAHCPEGKQEVRLRIKSGRMRSDAPARKILSV